MEGFFVIELCLVCEAKSQEQFAQLYHNMKFIYYTSQPTS